MIELADSQYDSLLIKKNELIYRVNSYNSRHMHLRTLENFVHHFKEIKDDEDREWIYKRLINYIDICQNIGDDLLDRKASHELFIKHLMKIGNYYSENLGFTMLFNRAILFAPYFILFVLLTVLFGFKFGLIAVGLSLVHYHHWVMQFGRQKVWGPFV